MPYGKSHMSLGCSWISTEWSTKPANLASAVVNLKLSQCCSPPPLTYLVKMVTYVVHVHCTLAHLPNIHFTAFTQETAHARAPRAKDITLNPHDRDKDNLGHVRNQLNTDTSDHLRRLHLPFQPLMMETETVSKTQDIHSTQV
jgi:hypothetical protein